MILLFLLDCTAHMKHIEAHIESFHRIVPVDLAVFVLPFFALRVRCKVACAKDGWQLQVWAELGQGTLFPSQAEVPRTARECRLLR